MAELSSRVWTVPNVISMARLALVPVFGLLVVTGRDVPAVIALCLAGASDWLDGVIARRFNQMSRLGRLLDPVADRLYIFVTLLGLAYRDLVPWLLILVIVARELFLLALQLRLRRYGYAPLQVNFVGKAATFALMYSFPLLLVAGLGGVLGEICRVVGWSAALWGVGLYWVSAAIYARQVSGAVRVAAA